MRGVAVAFLLTMAVIWDIGQNNGYWVRTVAVQITGVLRSTGVL